MCYFLLFLNINVIFILGFLFFIVGVFPDATGLEYVDDGQSEINLVTLSEDGTFREPPGGFDRKGRVYHIRLCRITQ